MKNSYQIEFLLVAWMQLMNLLANEEIDIIFDLRAEVKGPLSSDKSVHQPIVDDTEQQDMSIQSCCKRSYRCI